MKLLTIAVLATGVTLTVGPVTGLLAQTDSAARPAVAAQETGSDAGLQDWLTAFRARALAAGIDGAVFDRAMQTVRYDTEVIRRDRNQSEFTKTIWDYLETATSDLRIANGKKALAEQADALAQIEKRYGVEKEIITAIWGLESAYGTFRGSDPVLTSLATLAYDGRRRAFFEGELLDALRILQAGDTTPSQMQGSWAGAMGHTQFMPSSFQLYAEDFTADGKRDIWGDDPRDALASTAAYLKHFGWVSGQPWGVEVQLPDGFDYLLAGRDILKTAEEWTALGVAPVTGVLEDHGPASLLLPGGAEGAAFLIYTNFAVIERYNSADAYVIGVGHLADRIAGGGPIEASWPVQDRALSYDERIELQTRLTAQGFDTVKIDAKIGPLTISAVRAFQLSQELLPDGYASLRLLEALRSAAGE
ncbi:MAG: lytic murein transglycosylase [Sulfitobacter litoralis]|jgi:membrane-bound lytic murein transglycosylase B|uniref:Lytic murein transglycosylase n=1 Tax=Sulfitobacter litoralis TaxID=335975 RepID=A0ABY0RV47_9RHOB|nr:MULTISPECIES: lytic murein transglycosylase [Sulfitobacter]MBQ0717312.1 lytic murein transglycosylase [Sulfitobacter litoralis]MBQ0766944.1 lytic murein transglycosylase [Sulfitobacter litoralis]MBQ0800915.1 lytic murein transglycosylase [Sulfitobacter litoralis]MCF7727529.1 lytic murein transglycosylase [Sulfitobacter sp. M22]MCF7778890.1 lytic murein transglycosylase [Sulfitobacter sp. M220]|tara:strand:- start:1416 stop:2672 length:1257 start_codon:yes stop_codon:yes gene_type:complete